tara:strand:- start:223 stop:552 length:330 start_codon:yes stop_codon:yes gene_type:complete
MKKKNTYSDCEIYGSEVVLKKAYEEQYGIELDYDVIDLYVCDGWMYYAGESWGESIYFDGWELQRLTILKNNGMLIGEATKGDREKVALFRIEPTNITKLNPEFNTIEE